MRYLKWMLQPVYLLLIAVLITLYVKREQIFPEKVLESTEAQVLVEQIDNVVAHLRTHDEEASHDKLAEGGGESAGEGEASEPPALAEMAPQPQSQSGPEESGPLETAPAEGDTAAQKADQGVTPPDVATMTEMPATPEAVASGASISPGPEAQRSIKETEPVGTPERADSQGNPMAPAPEKEVMPSLPPSATVPPIEVWRAARAAVWQGDLQGAITNYRTLIRLQPENYDAYGEMGNVLLAQGRVEKAIEAYASASRLIKRAGHRQMAFRVAAIVATLDRSRGEALFDELAH